MIQNLKYILSGFVVGAILVAVYFMSKAPDEVTSEKVELLIAENAELKNKLAEVEVNYQKLKSENKNTTKIVYQKADGSSYTKEVDKSQVNEQVTTQLKWKIAEQEYRIEQLQHMLKEKVVEKNRPGGLFGLADFDKPIEHKGYSAGAYLHNYAGTIKLDSKLSYSGFSVGLHIPLNL